MASELNKINLTKKMLNYAFLIQIIAVTLSLINQIFYLKASVLNIFVSSTICLFSAIILLFLNNINKKVSLFVKKLPHII